MDGAQLAEISSFNAFTKKFGAQITAADTDGDGKDEVIAGIGPSSTYAPLIRIFNVDGTMISQIKPFKGTLFGVTVAATDLDGDGKAEIVAGLGPDPLNLAKLRVLRPDGTVLTALRVYPKKYRHGVRVFTGRVGK